MAVNISINPYYDDFAESKNFNKILFKPSFAIQSRELNQVQSILGNQIKILSGHIFESGTRVSKDSTPSVFINEDTVSVKLNSTYSGSAVNVNSFLNTYVTGVTSNVIGRVDFIYAANDPSSGDPPTLVLSLIRPSNSGEFIANETLNFYTSVTNAIAKSSTSLNATAANVITKVAVCNTLEYSNEITITSTGSTIKVGDLVTGAGLPNNISVTKVISNSTILVNENVGVTGTGSSLTFTTPVTSKIQVVKIGSGYFYKNGYFIRVNNSTTVVDKYTNYPSKAVILKYNESVIDSNDDTSLLDPALGSSNYTAPGADRLRITLDCQSIDLNSSNKPDTTDDYIEIVRFVEGRKEVIQFGTEYSYLASELASRTFNESGNYTVEPFTIYPNSIRRSSNNAIMTLNPGKMYIGGYEVASYSPIQFSLPVSRDYATIENMDVSNYTGSYIIVDAPTQGLFSTTQIKVNEWYEAHSITSPVDNTTLLGYFVAKHLEYHSGSGASKLYRLYGYYYEPKASGLQIRSLVCAGTLPIVSYGSLTSKFTIASQANGGIDANGEVIIYEANSDKLIFNTKRNFVKGLDNIFYEYAKVYRNISFVAGFASLTLGTGETFKGAPTIVSTEDVKRYYALVISTGSGITYATSGINIPLDTTATLSLSADSKTLTINLGVADFFGAADIYVTIETRDTSIRTKNLVQNHVANANIQLAGYPYSLNKSDIKRVKGVYRLGSNVYTGNYSNTTVYAANDLVHSSGIIYKANTAVPAGTLVSNVLYWNKFRSDPLTQYNINDGQYDTFYYHGTLEYVGNINNMPGNSLIIMDYYTHTGTGPITVNSYPNYEDIPDYVSKVDGKVISLRDSLDFRPRRVDDNPVITFNETSKPNAYQSLEADTTYYLGRVDNIYLQNRTTGNLIYVDSGIASSDPSAKPVISNSQQELIASVYIPPYTYTSSAIRVVNNNNKRYTMKDIADLDKRLNKVEKTVKLHSLELAALKNNILDATGNLMLKVGVFIDDFSTLSKADTNDKYHMACIDIINKECKPLYSANFINVFFDTDPDVNVNDNYITMNYTEEEFINFASPTLSSTSDAGDFGVLVSPTRNFGAAGSVTIFPAVWGATGGTNPYWQDISQQLPYADRSFLGNQMDYNLDIGNTLNNSLDFIKNLDLARSSDNIGNWLSEKAAQLRDISLTNSITDAVREFTRVDAIDTLKNFGADLQDKFLGIVDSIRSQIPSFTNELTTPAPIMSYTGVGENPTTTYAGIVYEIDINSHNDPFSREQTIQGLENDLTYIKDYMQDATDSSSDVISGFSTNEDGGYETYVGGTDDLYKQITGEGSWTGFYADNTAFDGSIYNEKGEGNRTV